MGEIPASEIKPGNVIRHFFKSDFGLHKIEGRVSNVEREKLASGVEYLAVTLDEVVGSDVSRAIPGAYLYGDGGLRMQNYTFGIIPKVNVLLLAPDETVTPHGDILAEAVPMRSLWKWSPGDTSKAVTVTVTKYEETSDGPWVHFVDPLGGTWALEPEAFQSQCQFITFGEPASSPA
jgi:hypothetical protein